MYVEAKCDPLSEAQNGKILASLQNKLRVPIGGIVLNPTNSTKNKHTLIAPSFGLF
jgi:hypothetical protein